jgi:hypothetical protein
MSQEEEDDDWGSPLFALGTKDPERKPIIKEKLKKYRKCRKSSHSRAPRS